MRCCVQVGTRGVAPVGGLFRDRWTAGAARGWRTDCDFCSLFYSIGVRKSAKHAAHVSQGKNIGGASNKPRNRQQKQAAKRRRKWSAMFRKASEMATTSERKGAAMFVDCGAPYQVETEAVGPFWARCAVGNVCAGCVAVVRDVCTLEGGCGWLRGHSDERRNK